MSAKHRYPPQFVQRVAEQDTTFAENARALYRNASRGTVSTVQLGNTIAWLQASAMRRYERAIKARREAA